MLARNPLLAMQSASGWHILVQQDLGAGVVDGVYGFKSIYPAQLDTLDALYVRTTLPSSNFESVAFNAPNQTAPQTLKNSTILAKIPTPRRKEAQADLRATVSRIATRDLRADRIIWQSPTPNMQSLDIDLPSLNQLRISITDDKGRIIETTDNRQKKQGNAFVKMSLLWQLIYHKPHPREPVDATPDQGMPGEVADGGANTNSELLERAINSGYKF